MRDRRRFLLDVAAAGIAAGPLGWALTGCSHADLPEGMVEVKWDRDTCVRCSMVLSDRRFAAQLKGGPQGTNFKFDDIGCVLFWLKAQPWGAEAATRIWVADLASRGETVRWLDARRAFYVGGRTSPMGYNFGAVAYAEAGALDYETMRQHVLAKGK